MTGRGNGAEDPKVASLAEARKRAEAKAKAERRAVGGRGPRSVRDLLVGGTIRHGRGIPGVARRPAGEGMTAMAREGDERPTEMPEKLFRQTGDFREIRETARQAEVERARERADAASDTVAAMAGNVSTSFGALATMLAGRGVARKALVAATIGGWALLIVLTLKWSGLP